MAVYQVSYDLNKSGKDYEGLYKVLKTYDYKHDLDSTWFINTSQSATDIYNAVKPHFDKDDYLIISKITSGYYMGFLLKTTVDWLTKNV